MAHVVIGAECPDDLRVHGLRPERVLHLGQDGLIDRGLKVQQTGDLAVQGWVHPVLGWSDVRRVDGPVARR